MGLVIVDLSKEGFSLDDTERVQTGDRQRLSVAIPFLTDPKSWDQYQDEVIYQADTLLRAWLKEMAETSRQWNNNARFRKFRFCHVFEAMYGRPYDTKADAKYAYRIRNVMAYYCTRIANGYYDPTTKKSQAKSTYCFKRDAWKMPPYSLRLRVEWLIENNMPIQAHSLELPKDDLRVGHARNPKTEKNMENRRQIAQKRYNEYQRRRKEKIAEQSDTDH